MAYRFGRRSLACLGTCHPDLVRVATTAILNSPVDFSVIAGQRSDAEQRRLFEAGKSQLDGVTRKSRHQARPSEAMDLAPYPIDWSDRARFHLMAGVILATAASFGIGLRWGGDWDGDGDLHDQSFNDLPHFELKP